MDTPPHASVTSLTSRLGGWLPWRPGHLADWLRIALGEARSRKAPFHPVIEEFRRMIEEDPILRMNFTRMFEAGPDVPIDPAWGDIKVAGYIEMLTLINHVLTTAPAYDATQMVGAPINAILDYSMITPGGLAAFTSPKVNAMLRKVLTTWASYLASPESRHVLNASRTGWLSPAARAALKLHEFQCDPHAPYLGFKSWNDFFIRRFKPGQRPVAEPDDDRVIVSACESTPVALQTRVSRDTDAFWLKSQPYSLRDMLAGVMVEPFVGGVVYQAYLSALNYHRWHAPVAGVIHRLVRVPGAYYAEAASAGFDAAGPNNSQPYIAHVATRALIFIEADNAAIGLMCVVLIGMGEVSSCVFADADGGPLEEGRHVSKGDQLGYFQFGGSTHCLVFRPGAISSFETLAIPQGKNGRDSVLVKVNSRLATAAVDTDLDR